MSIHTKTRFVLGFLFFISTWAEAADLKVCSLQRPLIEKEEKLSYRVSDRARTLYMISRDLYGDDKQWKQIARWNKISPPFKVTHGQVLEIKDAPTIDETKSNEVLIAAWTKLHSPSMANKLTSYNNEMDQCHPKPEVHAGPVMTEVKPEPTAAPAPKITTIKEPVKSPVVSPHEEHMTEAKTHHEWAYSAALTTSVFDLSSTEDANGIKHTLHTKINYGVNLGVHYEKSENWIFSLDAGLEHVQFKSPNEPELALEKDNLNLMSFHLEAEYKLNPYVIASVGALYVQRPAYRPLPTGVAIDAIFLPELTAGAEFRLFETGRSEMGLVTELSYSFATKTEDHDVKSGYGYIAGFKFQYKFEHGVLSLLPAYRFLKEDSKAAKEEQQAGLLNIGWEM